MSARRHRRGALRCGLPRGASHFASLAPGAVSEHLLRRRHAVADGARDRGAILDRIAALWTVEPTPRSRSKPTRPSVEADASQATAPPASTACRSACRRSTMRASRRSGASTRAMRLLPRSPSPSATSSACPSTSSMRGRGRRAGLARGARLALDPRAGPPLALSAHHRGGHAVRRAARRRCAEGPEGALRRALILLTQELCDAAGLPPTKSRTMRGLEPSRGTICFIGAATIMPASGRAPIAASARRRQTCHRGSQVAGSLARSRRGIRSWHRAGRGPDPAKLRRRISADGLAPRRRHRSEAARRHRWANSTRRGCNISRPKRPRQARLPIACRPPAKAGLVLDRLIVELAA